MFIGSMEQCDNAYPTGYSTHEDACGKGNDFLTRGVQALFREREDGVDIHSMVLTVLNYTSAQHVRTAILVGFMGGL